jgi:hypothetical protein
VADVQPIHALYYPHFEFGSTAWLKSILFYWEGCLRGIPGGIEPRDAPEVTQLCQAGLVKNFDAQPSADRAIEIVGRELDRRLVEGKGRLPPCLLQEGLRVRGADPRFVERGCARIGRLFEERGWHHSACAMAEKPLQVIRLIVTIAVPLISSQRRVAPMTDEAASDVLCTYFQDEKVTNRSEELDPRQALAAAQVFVPVPSVEVTADLSVERLLELRDELAVPRRQFRERVQARVGAIAGLPTREAVQDHLEAFARELDDELEAMRRAMKQARRSDCWSFLGVSAPASVAAGIALAETSLAAAGPIGGVASVALSVSGWFFQRRKQQAPTNNYLLSVDTALDGGHQQGRLSRDLKALFASQ